MLTLLVRIFFLIGLGRRGEAPVYHTFTILSFESMAANTHYLELSQIPVTFDPIDQVESAFFDQSNFQMFCVHHGFTDVRVKGLSQEDNFKVTIPARGPVSTIKFSGGTPRILSVQRRKVSVEFINIFAEKSIECSLPLKPSNADIIGFYWIFKNEFLLLITTAGVELYHCNPYRMTFKPVKSYTLAISWAIFSPEELILLVNGKASSIIHPFTFKQGSQSSVIGRLPKFEVEVPAASNSGSSSRDMKNATLMERDVIITNIYGVHYVAVIRNIAILGQGAEVALYQLGFDQQTRLVHVLSIDVAGRFTISVADNLVIVHHQACKTSFLYDISLGGEASGQVKRHQPVLAPLAIAPTTLQIKQKGGKMRAISPSESLSTSPGSSNSSSPSFSLTGSTTKTITPELYSPKWVFFQPNIIVDAQYGVIWRLWLNLGAISSMMADKCVLLRFLLMRSSGKGVILSVCRECLEPGRQVSLGILGGMFDQINQANKAMQSSEGTEHKYKVLISQRDIYARLFVQFAERKDMPYRFLVAAIVEYIRSLHKLQLPVEHFLFELLMNILIENKSFYQLHQFLQYHVITDSKPLACLLLSRELVYPPATQLAMDMFKRLSTADSEIIDILLSRGELLTALRYVKATGKVDTVSARQFLEAAANEDDKMLFYTVYKFFEERNVRLRRKPNFPPDEHCQPYEELYRKWFIRSKNKKK